MPTVLCLNNYDIGWFAEDPPSSPKHFLYGIDHLHPRGFRVVVCGDGTRRLLRWLQKLAEKARLPFGSETCLSSGTRCPNSGLRT